MRELRVRTILDLAGNYGQQISAHDRATQKFIAGTQYGLGAATRSWSVFGAKIDSAGNNFWARVAGAGGLALAVRQAATYDESITRIGINANVSGDRMERFKQQLFQIADRPDVNVKVDNLAAGMAAIVERTGDLEFASKNMLNVGRLMQATGESADDIGELIGNIHTFGVDAPDDILKVVGAWDEMGKKSGLSLKSMINRGQEVLTLYQQMGRKGPDALKEVGALMALATKQLGSPRLATGASTELLQGLKQNLGLTVGLGITDENGHMIMPLDQALKKIIETYHGNAPGLSKVFGSQGETLLTPLIDEYKSGKPMDALQKFMDVQSDGNQVVQDAATAAKTATQSFNKLFDEFQKFGDSNLSKDLKGVAAEINSIDPSTIQSVFKGLEYAGGGLLALYGIRKLHSVGGSVMGDLGYIFTGKRGGGLGGALGGAGGATPVFVVNMGAGGMGGGATWGGGEPDWSGAGAGGGKMAKLAKGAAIAGRGLEAFGVGYGVGTMIYDATDDSKFMDHVGSAVAHFVSLFSDDAKQAIDQRHAADAQLDKNQAQRDANVNVKLTWDAEGNPVIKNITRDNANVSVDFTKYNFGGIQPLMN